MSQERPKPPCAWPEKTPFPADVIHTIAQEQVVESCYPDVLGDLDGDERVAARQELYDRALLDFGFVQSRALEFALVSLAITACEATARPQRCADCAVDRADPNGLWPAYTDLESLALARGIPPGDLAQLLSTTQKYARRQFGVSQNSAQG